MITVQMPPLSAGDESCFHLYSEDYLAIMTCIHCGKEIYSEHWDLS